MHIVAHINTSQPHQLEHGFWIEKGLKKLGYKLEISNSPFTEADIHIVSGPHFAKKYWLDHPRTILLDRAYYQNDPKPSGMASMPYVSLGWMRKDGGRNFKIGAGRKSPKIKDKKAEGGTIFLADFNGPVEQADTIRKHPAEMFHVEPLEEALSHHQIAIGYQTTALVTAGLMGLDIICKDQRNIMAEPNWLELLPYADWNYQEIESGEALDHLWQQL